MRRRRGYRVVQTEADEGPKEETDLNSADDELEEQEERATVRQEGWIVLARSFSASALLTVSLILSRPIDLYFCSILICTDKS